MRLTLSRIAIPAAILAAFPAVADSFALKATDSAFSAEELDTRLRGQVLTFYDDGQSHYYDDGRYSYTYAEDGGTAYGYWDITPEGSVCIQFLNEATRCDMYVMNGERMILITEEGHRFPVRP